MTPVRKAALQWLYGRGAVLAPLGREGAPTVYLFSLMKRDKQVCQTPEGWPLTDKGRRDLHEG